MSVSWSRQKENNRTEHSIMNLFKTSFIAFATILLATYLVAQELDEVDNTAQDGGAKNAVAEKQDEPKGIEIDGQRIVNLWPGHEKELFGEDGSGRWRFFMHGITDENAQPFGWSSMIPGQNEKLLSVIRIRNDVKESGLHSICLEGGSEVTMARPFIGLSELNGRKGATLRLFVWIKGEDTGNGGNLWDSAPNVSLILLDANGKEIRRSDSQFRTRGSFPWFCYHLEIVIPDNISIDGSFLGGLFIRLANPASGKAWFCTPSWEFLSIPEAEAAGGRPLDSWADPKRGTFAPNPDYDEMPMNFFFGLPNAKNVSWTFLEGNFQAHSIALSYDVERYVERFVGDWFHLTQSIPYLLSLHAIGVQTGRLQNLQTDWTERFVTKLAEFQNPKTGLWETDGYGNLYATYLIVANCFSPAERQRPNEKLRETPWLAVNGKTVPNAEALVNSILAAQNRKDGVLAGWNKYAFRGQDIIDASRDAVAFDIDSSAAAVAVLMQCHSQLSSTLKAKVEEAVKAAYLFAVAHLMDSSCHWYSNEMHSERTTSPMLFKFLESTQALDTKVNASNIALPNISVDFQGSSLKATIPAMSLDISSIRIYAVAEDKSETSISDSDLLAVIRNPSQTAAGYDPLLLVNQTCAAWEKNPRTKDISAEDAGAPLLKEKMKALALAAVDAPNRQGMVNITMPLQARKHRLVIVASDSYGNLSAPKVVMPPLTPPVTPNFSSERDAAQ